MKSSHCSDSPCARVYRGVVYSRVVGFMTDVTDAVSPETCAKKKQQNVKKKHCVVLG